MDAKAYPWYMLMISIGEQSQKTHRQLNLYKYFFKKSQNLSSSSTIVTLTHEAIQKLWNKKKTDTCLFTTSQSICFLFSIKLGELKSEMLIVPLQMLDEFAYSKIFASDLVIHSFNLVVSIENSKSSNKHICFQL